MKEGDLVVCVDDCWNEQRNYGPKKGEFFVVRSVDNNDTVFNHSLEPVSGQITIGIDGYGRGFWSKCFAKIEI